MVAKHISTSKVSAKVFNIILNNFEKLVFVIKTSMLIGSYSFNTTWVTIRHNICAATPVLQYKQNKEGLEGEKSP